MDCDVCPALHSRVVPLTVGHDARRAGHGAALGAVPSANKVDADGRRHGSGGERQITAVGRAARVGRSRAEVIGRVRRKIREGEADRLVSRTVVGA